MYLFGGIVCIGFWNVIVRSWYIGGANGCRIEEVKQGRGRRQKAKIVDSVKIVRVFWRV